MYTLQNKFLILEFCKKKKKLRFFVWDPRSTNSSAHFLRSTFPRLHLLRLWTTTILVLYFAYEMGIDGRSHQRF
jgi:hypothetical protein